MSDLMLYGVLRMPYELAMEGEISRLQFYQRAQEAADRLERADVEIAELRAALADSEANLSQWQAIGENATDDLIRCVTSKSAALAATAPTVAVDEPFCYMSEAYEVALLDKAPDADSQFADMFPVYRAKLSAGVAIPAGWALVPVEPTEAIICAIEAMADQQLNASRMSPVNMVRQDGGDIWEAAIAAAPEAPVTSPEGWQPIETAPKDATHILICRATDASGKPMGVSFGLFTQRAAWWAGEDGGRGAWIVYSDMIMEPTCFFEPTHWMPIPAAPSPEAK